MSRLIILFFSLTFSFLSIAHEKAPIRVALSGAFVSEAGAGVYDDILKYASAKTGIPMELATGLSYDTINKMIKDGAIDGGFVCGLPYVLLNEKGSSVDLAIAPVMRSPRYGGKPVYYSDLIVPKDSPYKTFEDLKGKIFAYNEELSNSGYNMPRFFFLEKKIPKGFFSEMIRTGSHEESIRYVADKNADFSFVDSLVLEYELHVNSKYAKEVRVIHSLGPAGIPPLVFSKKMDKNIKKAITDALSKMHEDAEGKKILEKALVLRLDLVDDSNYKGIRDMYQFAKSKKALVIGK